MVLSKVHNNSKKTQPYVLDLEKLLFQDNLIKRKSKRKRNRKKRRNKRRNRGKQLMISKKGKLLRMKKNRNIRKLTVYNSNKT